MELTATLRLELVKPENGDWEELRNTLRALRTPIHRVMNNSITDLEIAHRRGSQVHPQTQAYRFVVAHWAAEIAASEDRVAKKKASPVDDLIAKTDPGSRVQLGVANAVYARWCKWRKDAWKGASSIPSFRYPAPIYVISAGVSLDPSDGLSVLALNLLAGRGSQTRLVIRPYADNGFAALERILSGNAKLCDARLTEERHNGKRKWQIFVSYRFEAEERSGAIMSLHRGMRCFLTAAVSGKRAYTTILETGQDILSHKAGYAARRRSLSQQGRQLGSGAKGHGEARRIERITRLESGEANWVRTKCQETAAHAVRLALRRGVGEILIEDWSTVAEEGVSKSEDYRNYLVRNWPFAQLRDCIEWAAKKAGLKIRVVKTDYDSMTCPICTHVHEQSPVNAHGMFLCAKCRLERNVDVIAAWNMLRRSQQEVPLKAANKANAKIVGKIKRGSPGRPKREGPGDDKSTGAAREGADVRKSGKSIYVSASSAAEQTIHRESPDRCEEPLAKASRKQRRTRTLSVQPSQGSRGLR